MSKYRIPTPKRRCRVCGCTDDRACPEGCRWVEPDLCSSCIGKDPRKKETREKDAIQKNS